MHARGTGSLGNSERPPRRWRRNGFAKPALLLVLSLLAILIAPAASAEIAPLLPVGPRPLPGWPVILGNGIYGAPAVADLDGDGRDELAVGVRDGRVLLLDSYGRTLPGWPRFCDGSVLRSPLFCDLNGDGASEVIAACLGETIHAWDIAGEYLPGWPVALSAVPAAAPVAVEIDGVNRVLLACADGSLRLLGVDGLDAPGWPLLASAPSRLWHDISPAVAADLDGDGLPEILHLSDRNSLLSAWSASGEALAGFPIALGGRGRGVDVRRTREGLRILCTTNRALHLLDASGENVLTLIPPEGSGEFAGSARILLETTPGLSETLIVAGTTGGFACVWNDGGEPLSGWPLRFDGFIYGLVGKNESFAIHAAPVARDVDGDGEAEILIVCHDQHLYCRELDGSPVPGWPLTLGDSPLSPPVFAQLDGAGDLEMLIGQAGETLHALEIGACPVAGLPGTSARSGAGEWTLRYSVTALLLLAFVFLIWHANRGETRFGIGAWRQTPNPVLFALLLFLLALRALLFAGELWRYRADSEMLALAEPIVAEELMAERARLAEMAEWMAAELQEANALEDGQEHGTFYRLERLVDRAHLDYERHGIALIDGEGRPMYALGLARGWVLPPELLLSDKGSDAPVLLGETPAFFAVAPFGPDPASPRLLLLASMRHVLPQELADATGAAISLKLGGKLIAWGGAATPSSALPVAWLGVVEPAREIAIPMEGASEPLVLRLAVENFESGLSAWFDLALLLILPTFFCLGLLRRPLVRRRLIGIGYTLAFLALYACGWWALTHGGLSQRPVPFAGHLLEMSLYLAGLCGFVTFLRYLIGSRLTRRLSFVLLGAYLLVALLPLLLVLLISASLVQQAQRQALAASIFELETRADHLLLAHLGNPQFMRDLNQARKSFVDTPIEQCWFDFLSNDQLLFTYELPTAYLTLWAEESEGRATRFTGFSYRTPRHEKFFAELPSWCAGDDVRGPFLSGGRALVRASRRFRQKDLEVGMLSSIPLDNSLLAKMEDRLRILPFLPRVRLEPLWLGAGGRRQPVAGSLLPYSRKLALPARDWESGAQRWLLFRAQFYLPEGAEKWTMILTLLLLGMPPLLLSAWGVTLTFRHSVRPLTQLLTGIRRVETGDLEFRLGGTGESEVARSAQAFDRMAASLQETVAALAAKHRVEELSRLKTQFLSMVSHDLKTPLSSIKGAAENVLAELAGPLTQSQRTYLRMILGSSENLQAMITELLDLSHIESGHMQLELELLDLRQELVSLHHSLLPLLEEKRLSVHVVSEHAEGAIVRADRMRLWQILNNVLANAIHYSPEGERIEIHIAPAPGAPGRIVIFVDDAGPGVSENEQERVFEPFYAGRNRGTGRHGAGLGLAIVRQLVELHGGEVSCGSSGKGGASFRIVLPAGSCESE